MQDNVLPNFRQLSPLPTENGAFGKPTDANGNARTVPQNTLPQTLQLSPLFSQP
jgi:hypothetical protein